MKIIPCENCGKLTERRAVKQKYCSPCNGLVSRQLSKERRHRLKEEKKNGIVKQEKDHIHDFINKKDKKNALDHPWKAAFCPRKSNEEE